MKPTRSLAKLTPDATFSQIVSADQKAGELLASIGLVPSEYKDASLRSVCQQRQWSEMEVLRWIKKNRLPREGGELFNKPYYEKNISRCCKYIEQNFHRDALKFLLEITGTFPRVHQVHGNQYEWLKEISWYIDSFDDKLQYYLYFESKKFFPLVKDLKFNNKDLLDGTMQKIKKGLSIIGKDQTEMLRLMNIMEHRSHQFKNPENACSTFRILNYNLESLCSIVKGQIRLEQEILIPLVQKKLNSF